MKKSFSLPSLLQHSARQTVIDMDHTAEQQSCGSDE